eukprot:544285-Ditylum_brightwellii.AAC.1
MRIRQKKAIEGVKQRIEMVAAREEECMVQVRKKDRADLPVFALTKADCWLLGVYGDSVHWNNRTHLDSRVNYDLKWKQQWQTVIEILAVWHYMPSSVDITPRTYVGLRIKQCAMRAPEAIARAHEHGYASYECN